MATCGFSELVDFRLCNGASELEECGATDYAICGMGGELIAEILSDAPYLKNPDYRLILQPMSRQSKLREYLAAAGFCVLRESYSESAGKRYVTILASYDGVVRELLPLESEFGNSLQSYRTDEIAKKYADERMNALLRAANGKIAGGEIEPQELVLYNLAKKTIE